MLFSFLLKYSGQVTSRKPQVDGVMIWYLCPQGKHRRSESGHAVPVVAPPSPADLPASSVTSLPTGLLRTTCARLLVSLKIIQPNLTVACRCRCRGAWPGRGGGGDGVRLGVLGPGGAGCDLSTFHSRERSWRGHGQGRGSWAPAPRAVTNLLSPVAPQLCGRRWGRCRDPCRGVCLLPGSYLGCK